MPVFRLLCLLFCTLLCTCVRAQMAAGEKHFSGIYQPSDAEIRTVSRAGWEAFLSEKQQQRAAGFRLVDLETYKTGGDERTYVGIFTESPLRDSVGVARGWTDFIKMKRRMAKAEYTMVDVTAVTLNEADTDFYAVWVKEEDPTIHKVWLLDSRKTLLSKTRDMAKARFKIKRVHALDVPNGEPSFVVLYHFSPVNRFNFLSLADDLADFTAEVEERKRSSVELIDFDRFREGNETRYVAVFQDGEYDSAFLTDQKMDELLGQERELTKSRGLKLVNLSVD